MIAARRIIFVAHSMGGIVARRYVVQRHDEFVERGTEIGLFLVASPSLGSSYASWLAPIARFFGHAQATALAFCERNAWLNDLGSDFRNLLARRKLVIYGKELVEDRFVILKRLRLFNQVVPPFSGATFFGEALRVPGSDHFSIAKPESLEAIQHRLLCQFIEKVARADFDLNKVSESNGEFRTVVGSCEICVVAGRIEDYPAKPGTVVVLPCNEYFDDRCTDDTRSALGTYVSRHFSGNAPAFSALIHRACRSNFVQGIDRQKTKNELAESFGRCPKLSCRLEPVVTRIMLPS